MTTNKNTSQASCWYRSRFVKAATTAILPLVVVGSIVPVASGNAVDDCQHLLNAYLAGDRRANRIVNRNPNILNECYTLINQVLEEKRRNSQSSFEYYNRKFQEGMCNQLLDNIDRFRCIQSLPPPVKVPWQP